MIVKTALKKILPSVLIYYYSSIKLYFRHTGYSKRKQYKNWLKSEKPLPPPHIVKQKMIEEYTQRFNPSTLVETGTFLGDMVFSQKKNFKKIISIELQPEFYNNAKLIFKKDKNIDLIPGDSGEILKSLAKKNEFNVPCLFWLDGHYSAGNTAKGNKETPIWEELNAILDTRQNHILLIDDARCFIGRNDYPAVEELKQYVNDKFPESSISIMNDIIIIEIVVS